MSTNILIAGHGRLGRALFEQIHPNYKTYVLRQSQDANEHILSYPLGYSDDTQREEVINQLPHTIDYAFFILTPAERSEEGYRRAYIDAQADFLKILQSKSVKHYFFISSTAVYSQNQGEIIDEDSAATPLKYNGQIMLKAEQLAKQLGFSSSAIRFSGIYGPSTSFLFHRIQQWLEGNEDLTPKTHWSNRIYYLDAARTLSHLLEHHMNGNSLMPIYNATDDRPTLNTQLYNEVAQTFFPQHKLPAIKDTSTHSGKQILNTRLKQTGFEFTMPSFKEGYAAMTQNEHSNT